MFCGCAVFSTKKGKGKENREVRTGEVEIANPRHCSPLLTAAHLKKKRSTTEEGTLTATHRRCSRRLNPSIQENVRYLVYTCRHVHFKRVMPFYLHMRVSE
ncbi:hypothetical protein RIF29_03676 [Crotalaria pallida]|uniref:Uncharacterized protein n=1 Tax=Crotalaria pallida TaxID=3830 RepID=A0AAN9P9Y6_CROPI